MPTDPDYFTLAEFHDLPDMAQVDDDRIVAAAAHIVSIIEREVGTSFIPRQVVETVDGNGLSEIYLTSPYVLSITSATVDGVAVTDTMDVRDGVIRIRSGSSTLTWTSGLSNVVITYMAGYSTLPPADIKEAAMQGTRAYLLETSSSARTLDRTSSISNDGGGTTTFVLAGRDQPTGYPRVDAVILAWKDRIYVPKVA